MGSGSLRSMAVLGILSIIIVTVMYLFAVKQVTDTAAPAIAKKVDAAMRRSLAPETPAKMIALKIGQGESVYTHYVLTLAPSEAVAADVLAVDRLLSQAAEIVRSELDRKNKSTVITCVAVSADGSERRKSYDSSGREVQEPGGPG